MKIKSKKLITTAISAVMAASSVNCISLCNAAPYNTNKAETKEISAIYADNDTIGELLVDELQKKEENEPQQQDYMISNFNYDVENEIIDVDYQAKENCNIFVGFYNDNGSELYFSMTETVKADNDGHIQMRVYETPPEYYLVKVYLIGKNQKALCKAKTDDKHIKAVQDILNATSETIVNETAYSGGQVIDFNNKTVDPKNAISNNFGVTKKNVAVIFSNDKDSIIKNSDGTFVFKNESDAAKLKTGMLAVVVTTDGIYSINVKDIQKNGTDTVITSGPVQLADVFSFLKIDSVTAIDKTMEFFSEDKLASFEANLKGEIKFECYQSEFYFNIESDIETTLTFNKDYSPGIEENDDDDEDEDSEEDEENEEDIPDIKNFIPEEVHIDIPAFDCLVISISPVFGIACDGGIEATVTQTSHVSYVDGSFEIEAEKPDIEVGTENKFYIELGMDIDICLLRDDILSLTVSPKAGLEAAFEADKTTDKSVKHHDCKMCASGQFTPFALVGASLDVLSHNVKEGNFVKRFKPYNGYVSSARGFNKGECDNYSYRVDTVVIDQNNHPVPNAVITSNKEIRSIDKKKEKIVTDNAGKASFWIKNDDLALIVRDGKKIINAVADDAVITATAETSEKGEFCISDIYNPEQESAYECIIKMKMDNPSTDEVKEFKELSGVYVVSSGEWPLNHDITYQIYSDGTLYLYGSGKFTTDLEVTGEVDIKKIIVMGKDISIESTGTNPEYVDFSRSDSTVLKEFIQPSNTDKKFLKRYRISDKVEVIDDKCFKEAIHLEEVVLPPNLRVIGYEAFRGCNNVNDIKLSSSLEYIGEYAFLDTDITSITIPATTNNLTLNSYIFKGDSEEKGCCDKLETVSIDSDYYEVCRVNYQDTPSIIGVFSDLPNLKNVYIGENVKTINKSTFRNCPELKKVKLSKGLKTIEHSAFMNTGISSIEIPETVEKIEESAFANGSDSKGKPLNKIKILNKNCKLGLTDDKKGKIDENGKQTNVGEKIVPETTVIYGYIGSSAQNYAEIYGNPFVPLDSEEETAAETTTTVTGSGNVSNTTTTTAVTNSQPQETTAVTTVYTYTEAVPNNEYVFIAVKDGSALKTDTTGSDDVKTTDQAQLELLSDDNILYFDQQTADEKGVVTFSFVKPEDKDATYILAGDFGKDKADQLVSVNTPPSSKSAEEEKKPVKYGDVNGDEEINLKDVVLLRRYIVGGWNVVLDEDIADVNGDGEVNLKDVVILRRYIAGGWNVKIRE